MAYIICQKTQPQLNITLSLRDEAEMSWRRLCRNGDKITNQYKDKPLTRFLVAIQSNLLRLALVFIRIYIAQIVGRVQDKTGTYGIH